MLVFTEHFRESTSTCRTLYSSISQTPNYLPVRVISFAVFLARLSVSLHEIAHTRAILPTYYEKKKDKNRYIKYSTFKEPISSRSEKYNKFGDFSKERYTRGNCFYTILFFISYDKGNLSRAVFTFNNLDADLSTGFPNCSANQNCTCN